MISNLFFNQIPDFPVEYNTMKIEISKKRGYLDYIKSNFNLFSQREIARKLGLGKTTVNRWSSEIGFKHRKHTLNEGFFDNLDENSSYILGLIFADGNIAWNPKKSYWSMTITASEKDKDHLEKIRMIMGSTKPLLYSPKTQSYRLIVNSKKLVRKLMTLGIRPNKSLSIEFPHVPSEYLNHFIRGVIDGDGNVRYVKREKSPYFEITVASGSRKFCEGFVKAVKYATGINANIRKAKVNTHIIQYSCSRGEKLAEYIYDNANIFLERKYLPYKNNIRRNTK